MDWSKKGTLAVVTVLKTKANTTLVLGEIYATGLINISLNVPKRIKKKKLRHAIDIYSTRTSTRHDLSYLKFTLDEMDKYPEMKGHYLIMDNASIHSSTDIGEYIHSPRYWYVYLPSCSPKMSPIDQL
jgi:hypothetical protein